MHANINKQPSLRKNEILQLESFLRNEGKFSTLILGEIGTGKTFWIEQLCKDIYPDLTRHSVHAPIAENTWNYWEEVFRIADGGILTIDNVEKLSKESQEMLFIALSTYNGKYGIRDKKYDIRIIFTSSSDISALRNSEYYLLHHFYDRISQLVVKFPSFRDSNIGIWQDFKDVWKKMNFGKKYPCPSTSELQIWLERNYAFLFGNFRDLDKIAINWQQYQLNGIENEKDIFEKVKKDFVNFFRYPEHKTDSHDTFEFKRGKTKDEIEKEWRATFKEWAKNEYVTLDKAAKELRMSKRTFEKW